MVSLYACINSVFNFRNRLIELRRGTYFKHRYNGRTDIRESSFECAASTRMIGMQLGSVLFGYVVTFFLVLLVCLCLDVILRVFTHLKSHQIRSLFIATGLDTICLSIAVSVVQIYIFDVYFVNRCLSNGHWIHRPFIWCWVNSCLGKKRVCTSSY
jgi:hypothetical protein